MEQLTCKELMVILDDFFKFKNVNHSKYYKALIKHCNECRPSINHTKETAFSYIFNKYMNKINSNYSDIIICSFVWSDTNQGANYWAELHTEFKTYFKKIHNKILYKD